MSKHKSEEPEWLKFIIKKRYLLFILLALMTAAIFFVNKTATKKSQEQIQDYYTIAEKTSLLQNDSQQEFEKTLENINHLIKKYPSIKAEYAGKLSQELILRNLDIDKNLASTATEIGSKHLPNLYQQYSENTLLIASKDFSKALENSLELKELLNQESEPQIKALYAYNLLRISALQEKENKPQLELETLQSLQKYLDENIKVKEILMKNFNKNDLNIQDFIEYKITKSQD